MEEILWTVNSVRLLQQIYSCAKQTAALLAFFIVVI